MTTCAVCGFSNPEGSRVCSQCGSPLRGGGTGETTKVIPAIEEPNADNLTPEELTAVSGLPADSAMLIVLRGPDEGARFLLDQTETTAGRHPSSDIFLDDVTVSRHHATFTKKEGQVWVEDRMSLNGTYVNRTLIDRPMALRRGDEVQIGKFRLVFFSGHG